MNISLRSRRHSQHEQNRSVFQKMLHSVIQHLPHRRMILSHEPLHSINGPYHMRLIDHLASAHAHEQILRMIRHADHLVGYDLAHGNDQVIAFIHHSAVDLYADRRIPQAFCDLSHIIRGNFPDSDHIAPPVMGNQGFVGNIAEHESGLLPAYRLVSAKSRKNIYLAPPFLQRMVINIRNVSRIRMITGKIRRNNQHLLKRSSLQAVKQSFPYFFGRQSAFRVCDPVNIFHFLLLSLPSDAMSAG